MDFAQPLEKATLVRRYKRFLADVVMDVDGCETTVHCPNPGAMMGLSDPGLTVWLSRSASPTRKLPLTLELVEVDGGVVGVNTMHPNRLVAEALARGGITEVAGYDRVRPEVKYGEKSRVDFLLERDGAPPCWLEIKKDSTSLMRNPKPVQRLWLEVKNCHLMRTAGLAEFPDCVAARSTKHLNELANMVQSGDRAVVLFVVQRNDCEAFSACSDLDPKFAARLREVAEVGVEVLAYTCDVRTDGIKISRRIPWK